MFQRRLTAHSLPILLAATLLIGLFVPAGCNRSAGGGSAAARIRLNEVMASNGPRGGVAVPDEAGTMVYEDWVELHNSSATAVGLTGWTLSDRADNPDKYEFPPGTVIAPGGYLLVFFFSPERCETRARESAAACRLENAGDPDALEDCERELAEDIANCVPPRGYVADFNVSGAAETLFLFADGGRTLVDQVGVRAQPAAVANGIDPVTGEYGVIYQPSPRAKNPPVNVKTHTIAVPSFPAACAGETQVDITVERDVAAPGEVVVTLEYADVDSPGDIANAVFQQVAVHRYTPQGGDEQIEDSRLDVHGQPVTALREVQRYMAFIQGGECGKTRGYRVLAADTVAAVQYASSFICCEEQATVVVTEYQPRNSQSGFVFEYVNDSGQTRTVDPDWIELHNFGDVPAQVSHLGIVAGSAYQQYLAAPIEEQAALRENWWSLGEQGKLQELPAGAFHWVLADGDDNDPRREYRLVGGDPNRIYFSTSFKLDPTPGNDGPDSFVLVDTKTGSVLETVVLDASLSGVLPDQSVGRFPEPGDPTPIVQLPWAITDCPTPEAPNALACDVAPLFLREIMLSSAAGQPFPDRCPAAGAAATLRTRLNVDSDIPLADIEAVVKLRVDGSEETEIEATIVEAANQEDAAPASKLYEVSAVIPAQAAGSLVVFSFAATSTDRSNPAQPISLTGEFASAGEDDPLSFRYVQGFVEPALAPLVNEVLPRNDSLSVHPIFGDPPKPEETPDFAEIHNPDPENTLDLAGYFLTTTTTPAGAITRPRLFRFPAGSLVPPGGFLAVYFGPPPADQPVPPDYIQVTQFNLGCPETLHLISPDDGPRGGNFRLDSLSWDLTLGEETRDCKADIAVGRICESCTGSRCVVELEAPSPGLSNATNSTLGPVFHDASYRVFVPPDFPVNVPVPPGQQVELQTVLFLDANLKDAFGGTLRGAIASAAYLVEGAPQAEYVFAGPLDTIGTFPSCSATQLTECATPPPGFAAVRFAKRIAPPFAPVVKYRLQITDACGNVFTAPESTFGTTAGEHPPVVINEINRQSPVPGNATPRSWIELFNTSNVEVDLSGAFLSNDPTNPRRAVLPEGARIPAGGVLLVTTDAEAVPPFPHAPLAWARISSSLLRVTGSLFLLDAPHRGTCLLDAVDFDYSALADGDSLGRAPDGTAGQLNALPEPSPGARNSGVLTFIRGDATEDSRLNVSDMIRILAILFSGETRRPQCLDALDADDNGVANLADPVYIGNFVFQKGPLIPPPFPAAGLDPTSDAIGGCGS